MTITFSQQFLVWLSFFVLFLIHSAIAAVPLMTKRPLKEDLGGIGFVHAIVTILYAAFYPVWFPVGVTS